MSRPRVLLADDHRMLTDALKRILEPRCEVVGTVIDGRALLEAAPRLNPDVVVLDIAMPHLNGLDAGRQLKSRMPKVKLIFMTQHEDPYLVGEAFRAGGSAFLLKEAAASELIDALDQVLKGEHLRHAQRRRRSGQHRLARPQKPRSSSGTHGSAAGSDPTPGRGSLDERSC